MPDTTLIMIGLGGFFGLCLFVIVPLVIIKSVKRGKQSKNFNSDFIALSGLNQSTNGYAGEYKGFPVTFKSGIGMNYAGMASNMLFDSGAGMYNRNTVYPKFTIELKIPGGNIPQIDLIEKVGIMRTDQFIQDKMEGKGTNLPELKIPDVKLCNGRIKIFSNNEEYAKKITTDTELQRLLSNWYYAYIKAGNDTITLIFDNNNVINKYKKRLQTPHYMVQALDICARIGTISK